MERSGMKFEHYFESYEWILKNLQPKKILEIGIQTGGSLKYWKNMFPEAEIIGVDIDENCKSHNNPSNNIHVKIGNQEDIDFLNSLGENFDLIIDDGGHTMKQQLTSFDVLMPKLNQGGIYVIEDLHTSYYPSFGGSNGSFTTMSFLKSLTDDVNANFVIKENRYDSSYNLSNRFNIEYIMFIESICFMKKK